MLRRDLLASASAIAVALSGTGRVLAGNESPDDGTEPTRVDAAGTATTGATTWPQYQHDARNTGHLPSVSAPRDGVATSWSFETGSSGWRRPPVVDSDTVYVGGDGLYALDAEMGVKQWEFRVGEEWGFSAPAIDSGVVCSVQFGDSGSAVYGVNAADGSERWVQDLGHGTVSAPVTVDDGTAFVYGDRGTHAIDVSSGDHEWTAEAGGGYEEVGAPAVTEDTVYVSGPTALDRSDGTELWSYDGGVGTSPVVVGDRVYGAGYQGGKYRVVGVDAADGTGVWQATLGSTDRNKAHQSPVIVDDRVIVTADRIHAFDAETGEELWTANDGLSPSAPVTDGETVYVASGSDSESRLRAFDAADGTELWTAGFGADDDIPSTSTPALADESVYLHGGQTLYGLVPDNDPPVADATVEPRDPLVGETVTLDASDSEDPENAIRSYEWDVGDDGTVDATGETATVEFTEAGTRAVVLTVTDDGGATDSLRTSVSVREPNETPSPAVAVSPSTPRVGRQVTLDASDSADPDGSIAAYEWDLNGDGSRDATGRRVTHVFDTAGTHDVQLTVTDGDGASASVTTAISVAEPTPTPTRSRVVSDGAGTTGPTEAARESTGGATTGSDPDIATSQTASGGGSSATATRSTAAKSVGGTVTALVVGLLSTEALVVLGVAVVAVLIVLTWEQQVE